MKTAVGILCFAGLLSAAFAVSCTGPGTGDASCLAHAKLSITATDGTCKGSAGATCTVWTQSQQAFEQKVVEWLQKPGQDLCTDNAVQITARAVATAIAKVWADSFVKLQCSGGYACGWTLSNGFGLATGLAEAVAVAVADASQTGKISDTVAEAFCYADIRAIGGSIARAAAASQLDVCARNGNAADYEESFAKAIQKTVATSLARASVKICDAVGKSSVISSTGTSQTTTLDLSAASECSGEGSVNRITPNSVTTGDACAAAVKVNLCEGAGAAICCPSGKNVCTFLASDRIACPECTSPWVGRRRGRTYFYKQSNGVECLCDPNTV